MAEENGRFCVVCGKALTGRQEQYCSKQCKKKAERKRARGERPDAKYTKVCPNCGKEFVTDEKNRRKYCSDKCAQEWNRNRTRNAQNKRAEKLVIICAVCGKEFEGKSTQAKYCSKECRNAAMVEHNRKRHAAMRETPEGREKLREQRKKNRKPAQKRKKQEKTHQEQMTKVCAICGNEFETSSHSAKYCSDKCRRKAVVLGAKRYRERLLATPEGRAIDAQRRKKYAETQREKQGHKKRQSAKDRIKKCAHCGKEFTGRSGSKFCSEECRKAAINQERAAEKSKLNGRFCKICGKPLTGRQRTVCSVHCASRRHAEKTKQTAIKPQKAARVINKTARQQRKTDKQSKKKERFCKVCGKPLTGRQTAYCSKDCAKKRNAEKIKQAYYKPAPRICKNCGKEFASSKVRRYCSDKCKMAGIMKEKAAEKSKLNGLYCKVCGKPLTGRQRTVCSTVCASKRSKAALKQAKQQNEPQTQICPNCGKEFVVTPGRRYCSDECREAARAQRLDDRKNAPNGLFCKICGKPLTGIQSMFCSAECERKRGKADKKHIPGICENCGKAFEGSRVQHFCSKECKYAAIKRKKAEGKSKPNGLFCKVCGVPLTGIQRIFCSTRCENRYYRKQRAEREKENTKD